MPPTRRHIQLTAGFVAFLILLVANGWITRRELNNQVRTGARVAHSREAKYTLAETQNLVIEAETGQRGYLYTGDPRYLAPYESAKAKIRGDLDALARLTSDNPRQQAAIAKLRGLVGAKFNELGRTIALYDGGHPAQARTFVLTDLGRSLTLQINAEIAGMQAEEDRLQDARTAEYRKNSRLTVTSVYVTSAVAAFGLVLLGLAILREGRLRERHGRHVAEREEWFRATLTSLGDAVIATDRQGMVTFVNPIAEGLLRVKSAEATARPVEEVFRIFGEYTHKPAENPVGRVLALGQVTGLANHTVLERSDGVLIPIEDSASPIRDDSGEIVGVVLVFRDASGARKTQELMRRTEKLAAAARLAATMAHEINNPLEAVGNLMYLVRVAPNLPEEVTGYLAMAEQELARVSLIARQTLGFYRETAEAGPVDVAGLVQSVLAMHENKLRAKEIRVDTRIEPCPAATALEGEIRQVVANLISNAADAVAPGGKIRVTLAQCKVPQGVQIVVEDDGPGIAAKDRQRLFEPFFTTKKDVGTGLGLWVSREIMTRHGGILDFEERYGAEGMRTAFIATLPLNGLITSEDPGEMETATA
jgi:PAS domain S-box-containing protein